jgi:hypothetical protein
MNEEEKSGARVRQKDRGKGRGRVIVSTTIAESDYPTI